MDKSLLKFNDFSWDSDSKPSAFAMGSPTWSNTSEGVIGIFVNEVKRNVKNGKQETQADDDTLTPFNFKLPETEVISNTIQSLNFAKNRRNTEWTLNNQIKENEIWRPEIDLMLVIFIIAFIIFLFSQNREVPLYNEQNVSVNIIAYSHHEKF